MVVGRVSTVHAPWLQYWPEAHCESAVQAAPQWPARHLGVDPEHCESAVQVAVGGLGWQKPLVHAEPAPHELSSVQDLTQSPSTHDCPVAHSLAYWQTVDLAAQLPFEQT